MKTQTSDTPAFEAGQYIQEKLASHKDEHILFLVAGGSALSVLDAIDGTQLSSMVTIGTTDERFTHEKKGNNFMMLEETTFYKDAREVGAQCISSKPQMGDTHESFTKRLLLAFEDYYKTHSNSYTIGLFGIGEDGHTASIFPTSESEFISKYGSGALYVPLTNSSLQYMYRTTITPSFIEEKIDDVVLYATGNNKCDNILNYMHNRNFNHYQIPALIPAQHQQSILFTDCYTLL